MEATAFEDSTTTFLNADLPPIIQDEALIKNIKSSTDIAEKLMKTVSSGNFFVKLALKGSMQQLWGMIRAM